MQADPQVDSDVAPKWLQAFRIFEELESRGVGQDWMLDGLHVWPMIKTLTVAPLIHATLEKVSPSSTVTATSQVKRAQSGLTKLVNMLFYETTGTTPKKSNDLVDSILQDRNSQKPLWCVGNTGTVLQGPYGYAHVHFDPYRAFAQSQGLDHWTLFYNEEANSKRVSDMLIGPNRGIQSELAAANVAPWRSRIAEWKSAHEAFFRDNFQSLHADLPGLMATCASALGRSLAYRDAFRRIFEVRRPKMLLCFNYYQRIGWALCAAAREAGIPIYDIQHGAQSRFHHAYHWTKFPDGGWNTTPTGYLLYGIPNDAGVSGGKSFIGAPSWYLWCKLAFSSEQNYPLPSAWKKNAAQWLSQARQLWKDADQRTAPWLMYASYADEASGRVENIEAKLDNRVRVLRKRHPTKTYGDPSIIEQIPLPLSLAAMDGLFSGYSATILEATAMGVPSFAFSGNASLFYEGLPLRALPSDDNAAAALLASIGKHEMPPE
jgi:hypothetical protein